MPRIFDEDVPAIFGAPSTVEITGFTFIDNEAEAADEQFLTENMLADPESGRGADVLQDTTITSLATDPEAARGADIVEQISSRLHDAEAGRGADVVQETAARLHDPEAGRGSDLVQQTSARLHDPEAGRGADAQETTSSRLHDLEAGRGADVSQDNTITSNIRGDENGRAADLRQKTVYYIPYNNAATTGTDGNGLTFAIEGTDGPKDYIWNVDGNANEIQENFAISYGNLNIGMTNETPTIVDAWFNHTISLLNVSQDTLRLQWELPFENIFKRNVEFQNISGGLADGWTENSTPGSQSTNDNDGSYTQGHYRHSAVGGGAAIITRSSTFTLPASSITSATLRINSIKSVTDTTAPNSELRLKNNSDNSTLETLSFNPATTWGEHTKDITGTVNGNLGVVVYFDIFSNPAIGQVPNRGFDDIRLSIKFTSGDRAEVAITNLESINTANLRRNSLVVDGFEYAANNDNVTGVGWESSLGVGGTTLLTNAEAKFGILSLALSTGTGNRVEARKVFTNSIQSDVFKSQPVSFKLYVLIPEDRVAFECGLDEGTTERALLHIKNQQQQSTPKIHFNGVDTGVAAVFNEWLEVSITRKNTDKWDLLIKKADASTLVSVTDSTGMSSTTNGIDRIRLVAETTTAVSLTVHVDHLHIGQNSVGVPGRYNRISPASGGELTFSEIKNRLKLHAKFDIDATRDNPVYIGGAGLRVVI